MPEIRRYRGATIFDDRNPPQRANRVRSPVQPATRHHNPYDYTHHYRHHSADQLQQAQLQQHYQQQQELYQQQQQAQYEQQLHQQVQQQTTQRKSRHYEQQQQQQQSKQQYEQDQSHQRQSRHYERQPQKQTSSRSKSKTRSANANNNNNTNSVHYSDHLSGSSPHIFPVVKLHRPSSRQDSNDYLIKRKVEKKTTRETEKTIKRKILLGDGRVIEDEPPEVVRDLVEDTTMKEEERFGDQAFGDRRLIKYREDENVLNDSHRRTVNTRDVRENLTQTAATKNLGPVSKRAIDRALRDNRPVREVLEQERERKNIKQRRRERERERAELILQRQERDRLLQMEPTVVYSSKKHRRTIDTEDVHNIQRRQQDGKVLTETYRTEEHEVMDDREEPTSEEGDHAPIEQTVRDKQGYSHKKRDEFTDYYRVPANEKPAQHLGRTNHNTQSDRRIERGAHNWDELSEKMRRERDRMRTKQRLAAEEAENAERKDALTKKPLNYNQEERTRKKETDKWLEMHFGSDWSLTSSSLASSSRRNQKIQNANNANRRREHTIHRTSNHHGHPHQAVRRSMSFSSIPVSYTNNNPNGEINRTKTKTKTKEKITKTTTTTYKPLAIKDNKTPMLKSATLTREIPLRKLPDQIKAKSATLNHPRKSNHYQNEESAFAFEAFNHTGGDINRTRDKISPTSPRQYHSSLSLTTPMAEYTLDEPLRAPSRLTGAHSTGHLLNHHYLPSELREGRRRSREEISERSASANNNTYHHDESTKTNTNKLYSYQRSASASSAEEVIGGRGSFARHIVEEREETPPPQIVRRTVPIDVVDKTSNMNNSKRSEDYINEEERRRTQTQTMGRRKTPPLYITEHRKDTEIYPAASENNLLFSGLDNEYEEDIHIGRKKSLVSRAGDHLSKSQNHVYSDQRVAAKEKQFEHHGERGHVSFADRLARPSSRQDHNLHVYNMHHDYSHGGNSNNYNKQSHSNTNNNNRNSSYHGFRSLERDEGLRSQSYHTMLGQGGSEDDDEGEILYSSSSGSKSSGKHRKRARSQSFLVKSTRPIYQYQLALPRDVYRKGALESDLVYDRSERKFVHADGMRHGHSNLRLDQGLGGSREVVHRSVEQLEPNKFKTIIFLNAK